ncbi:hypothetical protein, variant 1 [Aphanomyces invadans]|uniref:Uncharacterized protein n=1 Tax=Aphanomyces invadans TaxID=157072 RepID=A0A024TU87_9STRA|nr:hypothetical protein, variant 1 [Aphanomyces invadans]ETV97549.1 hypothetical protein, variant 1 [Aphanomyces invadans]|eukprot:XP_008873763.1 hypothetical protein, variant 1 [Aphanomyces invadans]
MSRQRRRPPVATGMKAGSLLQYLTVQGQHPLLGQGEESLPSKVESSLSCGNDGPPTPFAREGSLPQLEPGMKDQASPNAMDEEFESASNVQAVPPSAEESPVQAAGCQFSRNDIPEPKSSPVPRHLDSPNGSPSRPIEATENVSTASWEPNASASKKVKVDTSLSEYERQRLEKMQQNAAFLASLGIDRPTLSLPRQRAGATRNARPRRKPQVPPVLRRSTRQTPSMSSTATINDTVPDVATPPRQDLSVPTDTCALFQYLCERSSASPSSPSSSSKATALSCATLRLTTTSGHDRADPQLKRIYSMASCGPLIAAGGHNGYISLYARDVLYQSSSLLSFRAHQGWCSGVNFHLSTPERCRLLTAANDGVVKLWAVHASPPTPSALTLVTASSSLHGAGIFSVDAQQSADAMIATGSKDWTVALSTATSSCVQLVRTYHRHGGVVKCVRFSPGHPALLASCGNDMAVLIHDSRRHASTNAAEVALMGHTRAANRYRVRSRRVSGRRGSCCSVRWAPHCVHTLVSTGFDGNVMVWDTRRPASPVATYSTREMKRLFPVEFLGDDHVVVGVDGALLVYDMKSHAVKSRGDLGYEADTLLTEEAGLVVAHRQTLSWFRFD